MKNLTKLVIWLCKKFDRKQLEFLIVALIDVLYNKHSAIRPKNDFKEQHPNYRNFYIDPTPPRDAPPQSEHTPSKNWKNILDEYQKKTIKF